MHGAICARCITGRGRIASARLVLVAISRPDVHVYSYKQWACTSILSLSIAIIIEAQITCGRSRDYVRVHSYVCVKKPCLDGLTQAAALQRTRVQAFLLSSKDLFLLVLWSNGSLRMTVN